jgi:CRISPR system Cascade subunit CasE
MHRTVMKVFPDHLGSDPRKRVGVLHRIDEDRRRGEIVLFLQSTEKPDFSRLPSGYFASIADDLDRALASESDNPQVRSVAREREGIAVKDRFVFRLQANTTKKILTKSLADGTKQNGKRVPVRGDEERLRWLSRRAAQGGFRVEAVRISEVHLVGDRAKEDHLSFAGVVFDGALSVTDVVAFRQALETGIGPAKAFGFGLLSLSRARKE